MLSNKINSKAINCFCVWLAMDWWNKQPIFKSFILSRLTMKNEHTIWLSCYSDRTWLNFDFCWNISATGAVTPSYVVQQHDLISTSIINLIFHFFCVYLNIAYCHLDILSIECLCSVNIERDDCKICIVWVLSIPSEVIGILIIIWYGTCDDYRKHQCLHDPMNLICLVIKFLSRYCFKYLITNISNTN